MILCTLCVVLSEFAILDSQFFCKNRPLLWHGVIFMPKESPAKLNYATTDHVSLPSVWLRLVIQNNSPILLRSSSKCDFMTVFETCSHGDLAKKICKDDHVHCYYCANFLTNNIMGIGGRFLVVVGRVTPPTIFRTLHCVDFANNSCGNKL